MPVLALTATLWSFAFGQTAVRNHAGARPKVTLPTLRYPSYWLQAPFELVHGRLLCRPDAFGGLPVEGSLRLFLVRGQRQTRIDLLAQLRGRVVIASPAVAIEFVRLADFFPDSFRLVKQWGTPTLELLPRDQINRTVTLGSSQVFHIRGNGPVGLFGVVAASTTAAGTVLAPYFSRVELQGGNFLVTRTIIQHAPFGPYRSRQMREWRITERVGRDGAYQLISKRQVHVPHIRFYIDPYL